MYQDLLDSDTKYVLLIIICSIYFSIFVNFTPGTLDTFDVLNPGVFLMYFSQRIRKQRRPAGESPFPSVLERYRQDRMRELKKIVKDKEVYIK